MSARESSPPPEPVRIGADGFAMLALSTAVMLASCGATLLSSLVYVAWVACRARCDSPASRRALVLGMRLDRHGKPSPDYQARLARAAALWRRDPAMQIVILGGGTAAGQPSEAAAGAAFLGDRAVAPDAILLEDRSRHTLENLLLYRAHFGTGTEPAALVTSRFHLARSALLAAGLDIPHVRCAAEQSRWPPLRHLPLMVFEAGMIHWYITGRSFARITGNRPIAARIS
jgi:vancomycin permeability regulator SanA